jgi:hypothetical protein
LGILLNDCFQLGRICSNNFIELLAVLENLECRHSWWLISDTPDAGNFSYFRDIVYIYFDEGD